MKEMFKRVQSSGHIYIKITKIIHNRTCRSPGCTPGLLLMGWMVQDPVCRPSLKVEEGANNGSVVYMAVSRDEQSSLLKKRADLDSRLPEIQNGLNLKREDIEKKKLALQDAKTKRGKP